LEIDAKKLPYQKYGQSTIAIINLSCEFLINYNFVYIRLFSAIMDITFKIKQLFNVLSNNIL